MHDAVGGSPVRMARDYPEDWEDRIESMFDAADQLRDEAKYRDLDVDAAVADDQDERATRGCDCEFRCSGVLQPGQVCLKGAGLL